MGIEKPQEGNGISKNGEFNFFGHKPMDEDDNKLTTKSDYPLFSETTEASLEIARKEKEREEKGNGKQY